MANKNDERILELKKQIAENKDKIGKIGRFSPVTNLTLEIDSIRYNINALDRDKLQQLLIKLHAYSTSANALKLSETLFSGYMLSDWMADITAKLNIIGKKEEERNLAVMEAKLSKMLSDEKQVELELDEIASLLNK